MSTHIPEDYVRQGRVAAVVVEYRIDDGPWTHGTTLEPWVLAHADVLRDQRGYVCKRQAEPGTVVHTRVRTYSNDWDADL